VARVLSIFTLGTMGGAPAGAVLYGVLAHAIGPHAAILIPGVGMLVIVSAVTAYSQLGRLDEARPAIG
jgi:hypothetical protein